MQQVARVTEQGKNKGHAAGSKDHGTRERQEARSMDRGSKEKEVRGFRTLVAWQKAYELTLEIYKLTKKFPREEIYGLTSQLQRAVVSVPANIAEGYERNHRKEYLQFLYIAKGSLGEVETYLLLAKDLEYLPADVYEEVCKLREDAARLIRGLIRSLA